MKVGDLIIIVEKLPDWYWLTYTTGHIGIIVTARLNVLDSSDMLYDVFFFHSQKKHPVPLSFMRLLSELDEER